tara:strand:- start:12 stop:245 length:234 start_codon:yes stop_codon:yes gene_type:complete
MDKLTKLKESQRLSVLSDIYKDWCKSNDMPKHDDGNYYSADDIVLDYYQQMPFEPTEQQWKFLSAFRKIWEYAEEMN